MPGLSLGAAGLMRMLRVSRTEDPACAVLASHGSGEAAGWTACLGAGPSLSGPRCMPPAFAGRFCCPEFACGSLHSSQELGHLLQMAQNSFIVLTPDYSLAVTFEWKNGRVKTRASGASR